MSYISGVKNGDTVTIWERDEEGNRKTVEYPAPYYFYVPSEDGDYKSLYGDKLQRLDFHTGKEFYNAKKQFEASKVPMFESDISPVYKVLTDNYYGVKDPDLNVTFYDIEVDYKNIKYDSEHIVRIRYNGKEKDISVGELRAIPDRNICEVFDEYTEKWMEVDKSDYMYTGKTGFSSVSDPYAIVNSVALIHMHLNKIVVIAIPPENPNCEVPNVGTMGDNYLKKMNDIAPIIDGVEVEIKIVSSERTLLRLFLEEIESSDIICGWNNSGFDDPYVGKRLEKMGNKFLKRLCFPDAPPPRWEDVEIFGKKQPIIRLNGRVSLDYLTLFKKYMVENQPSYSLEFIADKFLRTNGEPDLPKLEYEGSLASLYKDNFLYFIRYNIRDTEILKGFEDKFKYVALANTMVHISTGQFKDVAGTIMLTEMAVINYCHHELDVIVNDKIEEDWGEEKIQGAIVLDPVVGMHDWVSSIDLNSLYPSAIRTCNISPDTKMGQFLIEEDAFNAINSKTDDDLELIYSDGTSESLPAYEWKNELIERNWCMSSFGTVFTKDKKGVIPMILEDWYTSRKKYQKNMAVAKDAALDILKKYE